MTDEHENALRSILQANAIGPLPARTEDLLAQVFVLTDEAGAAAMRAMDAVANALAAADPNMDPNRVALLAASWMSAGAGVSVNVGAYVARLEEARRVLSTGEAELASAIPAGRA